MILRLGKSAASRDLEAELALVPAGVTPGLVVLVPGGPVDRVVLTFEMVHGEAGGHRLHVQRLGRLRGVRLTGLLA